METHVEDVFLHAIKIPSASRSRPGIWLWQDIGHAFEHDKTWLQIVGGIGRNPGDRLPAPLPALGEIAAVELRVIVPRECSSIGQSNNYHSNKGPQGVSAKLKRADFGRGGYESKVTIQ